MNLPGDLRLAALAGAAYSAPATWATDRVHAVATAEDGITVVAFRGTDPRELADWRRDLAAWPSRADAVLGLVHAGFLGDVLAIAAAIRRDLAGAPAVLTGHSKGAAEALVLAALLAAAGAPPLAVTTFGSPRPGALRGLVGGLAGRDYWHGADPVPLLPAWLPHPRPMTTLGRVGLRDVADPIADHLLARYAAALAEAAPG